MTHKTYTKWDDVREDMRVLAQEALTGNPHFLKPPDRPQPSIVHTTRFDFYLYFEHPETSSVLKFDVRCEDASRACPVVNAIMGRHLPRMRYVEEAEKFVEFFSLLKESPENEWDEIFERFEHITVDGEGSGYLDVERLHDRRHYFPDCINDAQRALAILEVFRVGEWIFETEGGQMFHYQGTSLLPHLEHKARLEDVLGVELAAKNSLPGYWVYDPGATGTTLLLPFDVRCDPFIARDGQKVSGASDTALDDLERYIQAERKVRDLLSIYRRTFLLPPGPQDSA